MLRPSSIIELFKIAVLLVFAVIGGNMVVTLRQVAIFLLALWGVGLLAAWLFIGRYVERGL